MAVSPAAFFHFHIACVLFLLIHCTAASQTAQFSSFDVSVPKLISRHRREEGRTASKEVSYIIPAYGQKFMVVLEQNQLLLPEDFTVYSYAKDGSLVTEQPNMKDHCHYRGYVENVEGSVASLSLCSGLRGLIHMQNGSLGIEPLEGSLNNEHLVYRLEDVKVEPFTCGTPHYDPNAGQTSPGHQEGGHAHDVTPLTLSNHLIRKKRAVLPQTHYVELMLVVDFERFNYSNRNQTAVREEMVQLANLIDSMYVALNVRVVLVGLEIWSVTNPISIDGGAGEVLGRFVQWRENVLIPRRRHDSAQLILKKGFGSTAGMAFVGTACSRSYGGGINVFGDTNVALFASIVAHELGHNLGMNHDDGRDCNCEKSCIMNSGASGSRNFSLCSSDDLEKLILYGGGTCLLNVPRPDEAYSAPYCGNKLVDMGEDCDCGSEQECEKDPCCEPKTCKLRYGAQCAYGLCCKNCKLLVGGSVCRSSANECDLPEYCNGSSPLCQPDVFIQNGHPCKQGTAYCYNGVCQHYDGQCQALFGSTTKAAPDTCFQEVNSKGDRFGNCGYKNNLLKKCESRNAMCGKLQCENVKETVMFAIKPSIIFTPAGGTTCVGVDFRLGSDVPDPGMVNEGTKCGDSKVCMNFECVSSDVLKYDCDNLTKCHGHGVCNSNKNCHCDYGWAPPTCELKGYGGSDDSGPTWNDKDTSLRDGLLVLFFLILPLLALALFVFIKRNELRQRFCRKKRSQKSDNRSQTNNSRTPTGQQRNVNNIVRDGHQARLLPPEEVVHTGHTSAARPHVIRPPPPVLSRPPMPPPPAGQLLPQRPAPPPPV